MAKSESSNSILYALKEITYSTRKLKFKKENFIHHIRDHADKNL